MSRGRPGVSSRRAGAWPTINRFAAWAAGPAPSDVGQARRRPGGGSVEEVGMVMVAAVIVAALTNAVRPGIAESLVATIHQAIATI